MLESPSQPQSISAIAIRRHIGTLMLAIAVVVVGIFSIFQLQVDLLPAITYPRIGVRMDVPGISPEIAVEEVTKPLEQALSATEGVVQVFSRTREGTVSLDLYFEPGGDIDQALNDTIAAFNRNQDRLPDVVTEARIFKFDPSQLPVYEFAIESASIDDLALRIFADEELSRELSIIPGVASVDVAGGLTEEVQINLDLQRLQALGIGMNQVLDALRERNQDVAGGRLRGEAGESLIRTRGRFPSVEEILNLSLDVGGSDSSQELLRRRIYLREVAEIVDGTAEQRVFVLLNGNPAVKVSIQKQPDANTIAVIEGVKARLAFLRQFGLIPEDMQLITTKDESRFIRNSIANVVSAGAIGTILAAIAVFLFLGSLRQTFIIVVAIPLATLAAIILMQLFGLSINIFSLGGLALGVGIVVDNSIVMLENISLKIEKEKLKSKKREEITKNINIRKTAEKGSQEVESALVASTTTNLVAVLPFLMIGGLFSLLFRELIITVSLAIAASLLLAVTVVPALSSRLLGIKRSSGISNFVLLKSFNNRFEAVTKSYTRILQDVINYRLLVIALAFLFFGGSGFWMFSRLPQEILPPINTGQVQLFANFPPGTNLQTNQKVMEAADKILLQQPETEYVFTTVGGFLFGSNTTENLLRSSSVITLKPGSNLDALVARVERDLEQLNLVDVRLRLSPERVRGINLNNSPVRAEVDVVLQGQDNQIVEQTGRQLLRLLDQRATLSRFRPDADSRQTEVQVQPDWERLADLGLTLPNLGETVQTAINGSVSTQLQRGERLVDIRVQLDERLRQTSSQLATLPLSANDNRLIRLADVATLELGEAPGEIQRINQRSVFIIAGELAEEARLSDALAQVEGIVAEMEFPSGVSRLPSYAARSTQEIQDSLRLLGGLAVFLVFVVMAVQYNSLVDPLVILFTVPLALAGGIFGLFITQTAVGATVLVGVVLLVGIVVNNAIVMVELANQLRQEEGLSRHTAILQAATARLRPILMTTITTVLGMFPLALGLGEGSEFLQPLGVVVFSGLALATLLTLFIIPCFYLLLHDLFAGKLFPIGSLK
ncbi:efflux RND transporter permease subunit [Pleurocapsales cyanobacterium LEGE 06147]|nr:efflux RND transporter permease subunit [Pleurocapsales cyanobacterium LEGE 06147]